MRSCMLCTELARTHGVDPWNVPLFASDNFVALPSIGALVEGWLLLVPKNHYISIGALPDTLFAELDAFKSFLCSVLIECYGLTVAFEHGASKERRSVGCGVDHAHLHLVPVSFDLANLALPMLPCGASWSPAGLDDCRSSHQRGEDYLYIEQPISFGRIATGDIGSQLFRRVIASGIGSPDGYNWREHPHVERVMATISRIRAWQTSSSSSQHRFLFAAA